MNLENQNTDSETNKTRFRWLTNLLRYISKGRRSTEVKNRLRTQILTTRAELAYLKEYTDSESGSTTWAEHAEKQLDLAEQALNDHDFETALASYHTAKEFRVYGLEKIGTDALQTQVLELRGEAKELPLLWQSPVIENLLRESPNHTVTTNQIIEAYRVIHEYRENQSLIQNTLRRRLAILIVLLSANVIAILLLIFLMGQDGYFFSPTASIERWEFSVIVTLFGLGGGLFYVTIGSIEQASSNMAAEIWLYESTWWAVVGRAILGGFAGLITLLLVNSGLITTEIVTAPLIILLAFASGLYLQKFVGAVESIAGVFDRNSPQEKESDRYQEPR